MNISRDEAYFPDTDPGIYRDPPILVGVTELHVAFAPSEKNHMRVF